MEGLKEFFNILRNSILRYMLGILLPLIIIMGFFYPVLGFFLFLCMFLGLGISFFNGRYWCYWLCPRGIFFDEYLSKVSLSRVSLKKRIPAVFRRPAFRVLWVLILMSLLLIRFVQSNGNMLMFGKALILILTITSTIGIGLGLFFNSRIWCTICPVGTFGSWIGKNKNPVKIDGNKCIDCSLCYKNCPMEINAGQYKEIGYINNGDCIKCGKCTKKCPKKILDLS